MSKCNIVLIVVDTLRFHTPLAPGSDEPFTFDGSDDFVRIQNAVTPAPWTLPSHVSLFTGTYLRDHHIHESRTTKESFPLFTAFSGYKGNTITRSLKSMGYSTCGFVANPALMPGTGFEAYFDVYRFTDFLEPLSAVQNNFTKQVKDNMNDTEKQRFTGDSRDIHELIRRMKLEGGTAGSEMIADAERMTEALLDLTDSSEKIGYPEFKGGNELLNSVRNADLTEPSFLFMNFMEAHDPYDIDGANIAFGDGRIMLSALVDESRITPERQDRLQENYSRGVRRIRDLMAELVSVLKEKGVYENSLIILTSDHGQGFRENGFYGHGTFLYDGICRVPLSIKMPSDFQSVIDRKKAENEYVSLTSIRKFMEGCAGGMPDPDVLFHDTVFSESYGIPNNYIEMFGKESPLTESLKEFDHRRIAAFSRYGKITVNAETGEIEEITHFSRFPGSPVHEDISRLAVEIREFSYGDPGIKLPSEKEIGEKLGSQ